MLVSDAFQDETGFLRLRKSGFLDGEWNETHPRHRHDAGASPAATAQTSYELLLKGGTVIDPRNGLNAVRDVAIAGGKIAAVAQNIPASQAKQTVDVTGLYVTPGLIDIHVHVYTGEKRETYAGGDLSVWPDGWGPRSCTTTMADAGSSGWRTFEDFKTRVIDRSSTRVVAFLNIVGLGMREG